MGLFDWLRGGSRRPNEFEAKILAEVERLLEPASAKLFRKRIEAINLVQRHGGGQEVNLYQKVGGQVVFPAETALISDARSIDFAEVETRSSEHPTSRLRAVVSLYRGNVASIAFDRPSRFAELEQVEELRARLLGPPFRSPDESENDGWPNSDL